MSYSTEAPDLEAYSAAGDVIWEGLEPLGGVASVMEVRQTLKVCLYRL